MLPSNPVRFFAFVVALTTLLIVTARAEDAGNATVGSITGTVTDKDAKAVGGVAIRLEQKVPLAGGGKGGGVKSGAPKLSMDGNDLVPLANEPAKGGKKIIAQATTDAQGAFSFQNLKPGGYQLIGGNDNVGWIMSEVKVEAGKETKVEAKLVKVPK